MPSKNRKEYTPLQKGPGARVVTIEIVLEPYEAWNTDDVLDTAQQQGAAAIVSDILITESFAEASLILSERALDL